MTSTCSVDFDELELDYGDGDFYLWHRRPFTGIAYGPRPDGSLWDEIKYVSGGRHGKTREWYPAGQLRSETTYFKGRYFGPSREWDENGRLRSETIYEYSYPLCEREWDEAGQMISETRLEPGAPKFSRLQTIRGTYDKHLTINKEEWLNR